MISDPLPYLDGDTACSGRIARPDSRPGSRPAILLVHDVRGVGLNPVLHVQRLLTAGYVVFAADMFGCSPRDFEHGRQMIGELTRSHELWRKRIQAGLTALQSLPYVDGDRVAAVGYCFGGSTALELALSGADVRAAVSFHGSLDQLDLTMTAPTKAAILVCTGAEDPLVPGQSVDRLQNALRQSAAPAWQLVTLSGAKHSFTNPEAPESPMTGYNARADRASLSAAVDFLSAALAP